MNKFTMMGALAALGVAGPALAQAPKSGLSYSYAELGYVNTEIDDANLDGDGLVIKGSWGFTNRFHAFASYADLGFDFGVDSSQFEIGAGINQPLTPKIDLVATVSYLSAEVTANVPGFRNLSVDDDGFGVGVGLRGLVTDQVELNGRIDYVDFDNAGDDTSFTVGGRYSFTSQWSAGADINFNDDGTTWIVGGRFTFGR
jgi:hypothetical protein